MLRAPLRVVGRRSQAVGGSRVVLWAVTRVCRNPQDEAAALRDLTRAAGGVVVLTVLAVVLTTAAFSSISLESWDGSTVPQLPGWLAVDVTITPMQTG